MWRLPLSVDDSDVSELLNNLGCVAKRKILYEKIRHPVSNKMTSVLNGNRFLYIEPLPIGKSLPRVNYCGGLRCLLFHCGQPKAVKHQEKTVKVNQNVKFVKNQVIPRGIASAILTRFNETLPLTRKITFFPIFFNVK